MKLTKEEIKFIDDYLLKNKVKYWDVRLELLDHIVSAVEDKIENEGISFNEALLDVHRGFGNQFVEFGVSKTKIFDKGLYQSNIGFEKFIRNKQKELGRKQRKLYWRTFVPFIKSAKFFLEFILVLLLVFLIFQYNQKAAFVVAMIISVTPEAFKIFNGVFSKSSKKSLRVQLAFTLSSLFLSFNYFFIAGFNEVFEDQTPKPYIYGIVFYLFIFIFLRHSFNIYNKIIRENQAEYKSMIS